MRGQPQFTISVRSKIQRHHADYGVSRAVNCDIAPEQAAVRAKYSRPDPVTKYHHVIVAGCFVLLHESTSEYWTYSEQRKKVTAGHGSSNPVGTVSAADIYRPAARCGDIRKDIIL